MGLSYLKLYRQRFMQNSLSWLGELLVQGLRLTMEANKRLRNNVWTMPLLLLSEGHSVALDLASIIRWTWACIGTGPTSLSATGTSMTPTEGQTITYICFCSRKLSFLLGAPATDTLLISLPGRK